MLTCKDCLCYDVCNFHIDEETDMTVNECGHEFINKHQYVKLPVFIGQSVWTVHTGWKNTVEVKECRVSMLQQKADKSWKFRISQGGSVSDYTLDDIGHCIFFSLEDAIKEHNRRVQELGV